MQAPPVFQLTVRHFGVWRLVRGCLTLGAVLAWAAWVHAGARSGAPWPWIAWCLACVPLLLAARGLRVTAFLIRWDGQAWHLASAVPSPQGAASVAGQPRVVIDAGAWLLLHWTSADGPGRWLPIQRRGHESAWHLLRCTLNGARHDADPLAAAVV